MLSLVITNRIRICGGPLSETHPSLFSKGRYVMPRERRAADVLHHTAQLVRRRRAQRADGSQVQELEAAGLPGILPRMVETLYIMG